jgi:hypothetical protein
MAPQTDPLSGRRAGYLDQYAHTLAASYRVDQIRREVQNEQDQVRYLDSLLSQARQTAAGLEAALQAQPPASLEAATALLKAQYEQQDALRQRQAAEGLQYRRETGLTAEDRLALTPTGRLSAAEALANAERLIRDPRTTPEKASAALALAKTRLSGTPGLERLDEALGGVERAGGQRRAAPRARALTPQEQAQQDALQQVFESTYFAGPSGIVGGYDGKAIADARAATKAPASTSFATAEDALEAALGAIAKGTIERADFQTDEDFAYAKEVYSEAKAKKAYRNDQRANFENAVLTARQEVASLEAARAKEVGTTYNDPGQEAIRRELQARGYKFAERGAADEWKNAYVQHQNTPDYGVYIGAHERVASALEKGKPIAPSNRAENIVTTYTMMKQRRGEPISIPEIRKQLDKVGIEGKLQDDAIAFSMAYWELGGPDQDPEVLAQKKQADLDRSESDRRREEAAAKLGQEADRARAVTKQLEAEQVSAVGDLRAAQGEANSAATLYARLRAQGKSPEEARAEASALRNVPATYTGAAADKVLMGPELAMERTARLDAARPSAMTPAPPAPAAAPVAAPAAAPEEELVFGGGVVEPRRASAAPRRPAPPAAAGAAPTAPLKPRKTSDALLDAMEKLSPGSEEYERAMNQLTRLLDQGS